MISEDVDAADSSHNRRAASWVGVMSGNFLCHEYNSTVNSVFCGFFGKRFENACPGC